MRTAILTDIHANLTALEQVLRRCRELGIDRYVCLGDTVGYGAEPNECCEIVRQTVSFTLLGNHDAAVAGRMPYDDYYEAARVALDWTREVLSPANQGWLASLPHALREGPVAYCHGSPVEPEQFDYIFQADHVADMLPMASDLAELTIIGHSHLARAFLIGDKVRTVLKRELKVRSGRKHLASVGSIGQPRDGDPRACFAVLDDEARSLKFMRVEYDVATTAKRIMNAGLPEHFAKRLFAGV